MSLILLCVLLSQWCFDLVGFLYGSISWAAAIILPFFFFLVWRCEIFVIRDHK